MPQCVSTSQLHSFVASLSILTCWKFQNKAHRSVTTTCGEALLERAYGVEKVPPPSLLSQDIINIIL